MFGKAEAFKKLAKMIKADDSGDFLHGEPSPEFLAKIDLVGRVMDQGRGHLSTLSADESNEVLSAAKRLVEAFQNKGEVGEGTAAEISEFFGLERKGVFF